MSNPKDGSRLCNHSVSSFIGSPFIFSELTLSIQQYILHPCDLYQCNHFVVSFFLLLFLPFLPFCLGHDPASLHLSFLNFYHFSIKNSAFHCRDRQCPLQLRMRPSRLFLKLAFSCRLPRAAYIHALSHQYRLLLNIRAPPWLRASPQHIFELKTSALLALQPLAHRFIHSRFQLLH